MRRRLTQVRVKEMRQAWRAAAEQQAAARRQHSLWSGVESVPCRRVIRKNTHNGIK